MMDLKEGNGVSGFLPMGLAETSKNEKICKTEIIVLSNTPDSSNVTVFSGENAILQSLKNRTRKFRTKRQTGQKNKINSYDNLKSKDSNIITAKKILSQYDVLCNDESHREFCKEFVNKLKLLTETKKDKQRYGIEIDDEYRKGELIKRETLINDIISTRPFERVPNAIPAYPELPITQLGDDCLLNRLMRQSGNVLNDFPTYHSHLPTNFLPSRARGHNEAIRQPHPQDLDIALSIMSQQIPVDFLSSFAQGHVGDTQKPQPHPQDIETALNIKSKPAVNRDISNMLHECPTGTISCDSGACVNEKLWCDGNVDCEDASDEIRCSCRQRVDKTRLCDGYLDCPFGEDEMGCFGCQDNMFSCENLDSSQNTCFTKEQRCNNIADCSNHKDETDCTMLAPSLHNKPLIGVSNTEGFLHRNFKGNWYAVCNNPYMWAHDACRRETGLIIRPPYIQYIQIDPLLKVNYLNTAPGGLIQNSTTCFNSSAVYITCPDLLCGTRIITNSHMIRENTENQLFGRNKRFLMPNYPYPFLFYAPLRSKRNVVTTSSEDSKELRKRMTEGRVVGGKPSQPAAWPWVVALYRDGQFHCGGVIINQNWIMSAAHCVHKYWLHYYEVQVGMLRRFSFSPQEQNYPVTHVIVNQNYDQQDMKNDLCLLKIKPGIQFSRWVRPICLPGPEVAGPDWAWGPPVGTICTAVGWGSTIEHGPDPDHLREVELPVWERCNHREDQDSKQICAGLFEGGRDTCQGDSGGPLLCQNPSNEHQWYVAGIVSHGDGCARKGEPGVYTRVSLLVPWIRHHTSSTNLPIIQPKQECPGFRCKSGISKCLPKTRINDKIIDCLDGEDEFNCDIKESRNIVEEILSIPFSRNANVSTNLTTNKLINNENKQMKSNISTTTETIIASIITSNITTIKNINKLVIVNSTPNPDISDNANNLLNDTTSERDFIHNAQKTTTENSLDTIYSSNEHITDDPFEVATELTPNKEMSSNILSESIVSMATDSSNLHFVTETTTKNLINIESNENYLTTENSILPVVDNITTTVIFESTTNVDNDHNLVSSTPKSNLTIVTPMTTNQSLFVTTNPLSEDVVTNGITGNPQNLSSNLENQNSIVPEIENNLIYPIEATRYKTKHKTPLHFKCHKISQIISYKNRCDHKADCEDGTDEIDCTCIDYLETFESQLICDGNYNCADGQDEIDCFGCDDGQFLCKKSQMCLSSKYVCDGKSQCPLGEDELDCFALTNGKDIRFDIDGRPKVRFEGFVTKKQNSDWHVICEENMSIHDQEEAAIHMCRYLGFSNALWYKIKYINVKDSNLVEIPVDNKRSKRNKSNREPVMFTYVKSDADKKQTRSVIISEPEVLKEKCLPNVTKTCMTLYVLCDQSLYTNFDVPQNLLFRGAEENFGQQWPWVAKLYTDGYYKCTGVLIDMSWVMFSYQCLELNLQTPRYNTVVLGSHKTLFSTKGLYEQVRKVDAIKNLYSSKVILLHLQEPVEYSTMVKPMIPPSAINTVQGTYERSICIAVGQDTTNNTVSVLLKESKENCDGEHVCFVRQSTVDTCLNDFSVERPWAGIISCHTKQGWYPAASFIEPRGECNIGNRIIATEIGNLKHQIKYYDERPLVDLNEQDIHADCEGVRCERGTCVKMRHVCDGVRHCEDGIDEAPESCKRKYNMCSKDPLLRGCECPVGHLKCRNGQCISKELFKDGHLDCADGSDEPGQTTCSDYLSRVNPSRLCDGVLHCHDRSDEDPMFCKCFAKHGYRCGRDPTSEDYCVATDMVCDGIPDCPNGEDERTCIALSAPHGTAPGIGEVIIRSHGVWYSKCYPSESHIKSELEQICRELGFISGHAKQLPTPEKSHPHNHLTLDPFSDIMLNNNTKIRLRNSPEPIGRGTMEALPNCYPLFIECL
ncbi:unnamed protein product [Leptosia nina]|uniref:limulus clotting factor C n=1 Tax=Leptosia nina TaxID=320188 RepID=A0AAV1JBW7_9NEOP